MTLRSPLRSHNQQLPIGLERPTAFLWKQRGIVRTFGKCPIFRSPRNDRLLLGVLAERVCFGGETGLELARRGDTRF
jgi:hypothetical protein